MNSPDLDWFIESLTLGLEAGQGITGWLSFKYNDPGGADLTLQL
jgi:hypothetical protein